MNGMEADKKAGASQGFRALPPEKQVVVFYAERPSDWDSFGGMVMRLSVAYNRHVCYLTADPEDPILRHPLPNVTAECCGRGRNRDRIFSKLAGSVVMITDRALEAKPPAKSRSGREHRVLVISSLSSLHSRFTPDQLSTVDTVFCAGPHHQIELTSMMGSEVKYLPFGASQIDQVMERNRRNRRRGPRPRRGSVLVIPDGPELLADCGTALISSLLELDHRVTLHVPEHLPGIRKQATKLEKKFSKEPAFQWIRGVRLCGLLCSHDALVTDWSPRAFDYAFALYRPVVFVDVPRRSGNAFGSLERRPFEIGIRRQVGEVIGPERAGDVPRLLDALGEMKSIYEGRLEELRKTLVFNPGLSGAVGAHGIEAIVTGLDPERTLQRALSRLSDESDEERQRYFDPVPDLELSN